LGHASQHVFNLLHIFLIAALSPCPRGHPHKRHQPRCLFERRVRAAILVLHHHKHPNRGPRWRLRPRQRCFHSLPPSSGPASPNRHSRTACTSNSSINKSSCPRSPLPHLSVLLSRSLRSNPSRSSTIYELLSKPANRRQRTLGHIRPCPRKAGPCRLHLNWLWHGDEGGRPSS
jgi:hypothetical protein